MLRLLGRVDSRRWDYLPARDTRQALRVALVFVDRSTPRE